MACLVGVLFWSLPAPGTQAPDWIWASVFWGELVWARGSIVVPFCGLYLGTYKVVPKRTTMESMGRPEVQLWSSRSLRIFFKDLCRPSKVWHPGFGIWCPRPPAPARYGLKALVSFAGPILHCEVTAIQAWSNAAWLHWLLPVRREML